VKDIIEACGVPHSEVDLIVAVETHGAERYGVHFGWPVQIPMRLKSLEFPRRRMFCRKLSACKPRRGAASSPTGTLGSSHATCGCSVSTPRMKRDADDCRILEIMAAEDRALLTRDRRLLMHSIVRHGYCPRSTDAEEQTREVLRRFRLTGGSSHPAPYTRCLRCNALLQSVPKSEVLDPLSAEPLTLHYYHDFRRCTGCGRIYWPGTHIDKLVARLARVTGECLRF
jgi:uncharacterized protein